MRTTTIASVAIGDRQRKEIGQTALDDLKRSIVSKGLLHPPVLTADLHLVTGERRLRAITQLHEDGVSFSCDGTEIPNGSTPYILVADLTAADLAEAELEENLFRVPLTWQEEVNAIAMIHEMRLAANPSHSQQDTAAEISEKNGLSPGANKNKVSQAILISKNATNPLVQRAKSAKEAFRAILDEQETLFQSKLVQQETNSQREHTVIHGDCREELPKLPQGSVSTIIVDPPYGIKADKQGRESNHYYDDSPEYALEICEFIIREGFRIARPRAIIFMFCDVENFVRLKTYAAQQAWSVWPKPLIWDKGPGGHAPWGRAGFNKCYETILFAVKGQAELRFPGGSDVLNAERVGLGARTHAAEKPVKLLSRLIYLSTLPGDVVLDPCAGSGSIIPAARANQCRAIAIERDDTSHALCLSRLAAGDELEQADEEVPNQAASINALMED